MTVINNNIVILHIPKCGGSSVRWPAIQKYDIKFACQHCKYTYLPEIYKDYKKIAFVRNPYDFYSSNYFYFKQTTSANILNGDPFTYALSNKGTLNFEITLDKYLDLTEAFKDEDILFLFKQCLRYRINNKYICWLTSWFDDIDSLKAEDFGHKSLYQWYIDTIGIYKLENVEIFRIEDQYEYGMKKYFNTFSKLKRNKTSNKPTMEECYNENMKEKVFNKDKDIFVKYKY